jgi:hypothetical protein
MASWNTHKPMMHSQQRLRDGRGRENLWKGNEVGFILTQIIHLCKYMCTKWLEKGIMVMLQFDDPLNQHSALTAMK